MPETIKVSLDYSELLAAINESALFGKTLAELPPSLVDRLISFVHAPSEIARIESTAAEGASQILALKPSDSFNDLLAALRTVDLVGGAVRDNVGHG